MNKRENSYGSITNARYSDADDSHTPKAPNKIIGDTGCSMHLIGKDQLLPEHLKLISPGKERRLNTASGKVTSAGRINVQSDEIGFNFKATVLDNCPCCLSIGQMVKDRHNSWSFEWKHGSNKPQLRNSHGDKIVFRVHNNVPYVDYWVDGGLPCVESPNAEPSGNPAGCPGEGASSSSSSSKSKGPGEEASSSPSPLLKDGGPIEEASSSKDKKATR